MSTSKSATNEQHTARGRAYSSRKRTQPKGGYRTSLTKVDSEYDYSNGSDLEINRYLRKRIGSSLCNFVTRCFKQDLGFEGIVIASFIISNIKDIFIHPRSEYGQVKLENAKIKFMTEESKGDPLLWVRVFKAWSNTQKRARSLWCSENCINDSLLRQVAEVASELSSRIRNCRSGSYHLAETGFCNSNATEDDLIDLMLASFPHNIGVYSGHKRLGYTLISSKKQVTIYPSSIFRVTENFPTFALCLHLEETKGVLAVEISQKHVENVMLKQCRNFELKQFMMHDIPIAKTVAKVGATIIKNFTDNGNRLIRVLENKIKDKCETDSVAIEVNSFCGQLEVYCRTKYHDTAESFIRREIQRQRKKLSKESKILPCLQHSSVLMTIGEGCNVKDLLSSLNFRSLIVHSEFRVTDTTEVTQAKVEKRLKSSGDIEAITEIESPKFRKFTNQYRCFIVTFKSHKHAQKVRMGLDFENVSDRDILHIRPLKMPICSPDQDSDKPVFRFKVKKIRRFIEYEEAEVVLNNEEDCAKAKETKCFPIGNRWAKVHSAFNEIGEVENRKIILRNLDENKKNIDEVRRTFEQATEVFCKKIGFVIDPEYHSSIEDMEQQEVIILEKLKYFMRTEKNMEYTLRSEYIQRCIDVMFVPPKDGDLNFEGYISTSDMDMFAILVEFAKRVESKIGTIHDESDTYEYDAFEISTKPCLTFIIHPKIYSVVRDSILRCQENQHHKAETDKWTISEKCLYDGGLLIEIFHNNIHELKEVNNQMQDILRPLKISVINRESTSCLVQNDQFIKSVSAKTCTVVEFDKESQAFSIYGHSSCKILAEKSIKEYLCGPESYHMSVSLKGDRRPPSLIRVLVNKYGPQLQTLREKSRACSLMLDLQKHSVVVVGSIECVEQVSTEIEKCCQELPRDYAAQYQQNDAEICVVCLCKASKVHYKLESCGHLYCWDCCQLLLRVAKETGNFPIICAAAECEMPFVMKDMFQICNGFNSTEFNSLAMASLKSFVRANREIARFCPSPDCPGVYRVSDVASVFRCSHCQQKLCTACHQNAHPGLSCDVQNTMETIDDDKLKQWMKERPTHRKLCPNCKSGIEKRAGCNHIWCIMCKTDICWACLQTFKNEADTYDHIRYTHEFSDLSEISDFGVTDSSETEPDLS